MSSPSQTLKSLKDIVLTTTTTCTKHIINSGAIGMLTPGRVATLAGFASAGGALHIAQKLLEKNEQKNSVINPNKDIS